MQYGRYSIKQIAKEETPVFRQLTGLMKPLHKTPFHPQSLVWSKNSRLVKYLQRIGKNKVVLDIGCFDKWPLAHLDPSCTYIGLDYFETATQWYKSAPDTYGDALHLPIENNAADVVLLLDVLEHLGDHHQSLREVNRVLKAGGTLIMQVPFLYPLHDEPRDFVRLTEYGFRELAHRYGFQVEVCHPLGHPLETAALLSNLALSKAALNWLRAGSPAAVLVLLLPPLVLLNNLLSRLLGRFSQADHFMPYSYQIVFRKNRLQA